MNNIELRRSLRERKENLQIRQAFWLDLLGLAVPLAAPLVPAYLTATAIIEHYPALLHIDKGWVIAMALIAGSVIEVLGILSIETMFDMRTFNATVQPNDERAPFDAAAIAVGFYLALVITLVLLLKIFSQLALWSLAPLTILGFVTSWVMVLRKQHSERIFKHEIAHVEQSEIERLNTHIEQLINEHQAGLNTERQQFEQRYTELSKQLQDERTGYQAEIEHEREQRLDVAAELNGLREQHNRLVEQMANGVQAKPRRKAKVATKRIDPERVEQYFRMNPKSSVRQASEALGYSVGSINQYKPVVSTNGHTTEA